MNRIVAVFLMSFFACINLAKAEDHLATCDGLLSDYTRKVESISRAAMPGELELAVTVIPSFEPEWSVGITRAENKYYLSYVILDRSLWSDSWVKTGRGTRQLNVASSRAKPKGKTIIISNALHDAVRSEWERSIQDARRSDNVGLDGTQYLFQLPATRRCASAWSPAPATRNDRLVSIVASLRNLVTNRLGDPVEKTDLLVEALHTFAAP